MAIHPDAGKPVKKEQLTDIAELVSLYYETQPDVNHPDQRVAFGTSGHRGTSLNTSFTEDHLQHSGRAQNKSCECTSLGAISVLLPER